MMGYVPPPPPQAPFPLNVDRHGLPCDYATYVWLVYGRVVEDKSPARIAFLQRPSNGAVLPPPDPALMSKSWL